MPTRRQYSGSMLTRSGHISQMHEAGDVLRDKLHPHRRPQRINAEAAQISVEVVTVRRQGNRVDPCRVRPVEESIRRAVSGRIVIADDIEPAQRCRKQEGGEMCG